mgnify:CR=1 FL=1
MNILKNKNFAIIFGLSLGILILTAFVAYIQLAEITTPLIIHFDAYKGIDFLGDKFDVFKILAVALTVFSINFILAEFIFYRQRFLSFVFAYASLATSVLTSIAITVIISVN